MKLSILLKVFLREAPVLLVPLALFIAMKTNNLILPVILWSSSMGADITFRSIDCAERYKGQFINKKRIYAITYLGLAIVITGILLDLNQSSFAGFGLSVLGFTIVAVNFLISNKKLYDFVFVNESKSV